MIILLPSLVKKNYLIPINLVIHNNEMNAEVEGDRFKASHF